jgi:hypothetical protein
MFFGIVFLILNNLPTFKGINLKIKSGRPFLQTVNFGHDTISVVFSAAIAKVGDDNKVLLTANQMRNNQRGKSE